MKKIKYALTIRNIKDYLADLAEQERAGATIRKYSHDLNVLLEYMADKPLTKTALIEWKEQLVKVYAPASVNSMVAAVNGFFNFMGWRELRVKPLKIQKTLFADENQELSRDEYIRLVRAAEVKKNERLSLAIQTICATGIRVSELKFVTVKAVRTGRTEVSNKGKRRMVFLPEKLCRLLKKYLQKQKRTKGPVFTTKKGNPLDRSNIWRDMKALCKSAGVNPDKVFPHNLRHLFARTFYSVEKDLSRLADILGHSNVATTRIYTMESGCVHIKQLNRLELVTT